MSQPVSDNLQHYLDGLDERAELHVQAKRVEAYAIGLTRGFIEGFGLASALAVIVFMIWRLCR